MRWAKIQDLKPKNLDFLRVYIREDPMKAYGKKGGEESERIYLVLLNIMHSSRMIL